MSPLGGKLTVAAMSLAELARGLLPTSLRRRLAVEVHDGPNAVLESHVIFEAVVLKPESNR